MNPHFQDALKALERVSAHIAEANEATRDAHAALVEGFREVLEAHAEHLDLRETVERLESTILAQGGEIAGLRADVSALRAALQNGDRGKSS